MLSLLRMIWGDVYRKLLWIFVQDWSPLLKLETKKIHKHAQISKSEVKISHKSLLSYPGQGSGPSAGPLGAAGGAEEQLLLRCGLWTQLLVRLHLLHHLLWPPVWIQQQEGAGQVGGPPGEWQQVVGLLLVFTSHESDAGCFCWLVFGCWYCYYSCLLRHFLLC